MKPYGWGTVLSNITHQQFANAGPEDSREILLPDHLAIFKGDFAEELDFAAACLRKWQANGVNLQEVAVLYNRYAQGERLARRLQHDGIPHQWLCDSARKKAYDSEADSVALMTLHSSKGLEFERVIVIGIGELDAGDEGRQQSARLLYVGMTRAKRYLVMTSSGAGGFSRVLGDGQDASAGAEHTQAR
ncbi:DNA helicase II related protein [Thioalkalivibrio nitratireducens DSM 14787]|uniref:DNA 3'-5' helicase II n=1 Tax=Thioalkalivibrio nitratireducens (strain DSM 14787 / UNIQEM 213 / ALEN2) TaxID=1255043 RepID=L0DT90_THIND|nr:DNA helicase II related protein [Thioalkalivibrio nitratireducens DSM 14787]